ncbi:UNVERIFIED_CONTAM: hypothetical protein Sradi_6202400 [Sesamum radiatum]|uniref:Transposase MuDR plant domain-containing protein n=1 Tax=Sesamum radiatum TaxID=300843 RepID=A0AAW2KAH2_SESRA
MSLKVLEGDNGITELLRDYKGYNLEYIPQVEADSIDETGASWEFVGEGEEDHGYAIEEEDVGEAVSNDGNEGVNANESEGVVGIQEVDMGEAVRNDGNEGVSDNEREGVVGTEEVEVGEGEGGESESNYDASSASECPSWMLEDLEGPWDDDIFSNRSENYTRTMLKTLRSFIKEKRKKKHEDKQNQRGETSDMGAEQWFSDCEEEELRFVRGSDDEGERCPEWNNRMDMGEVDLAMGIKFETKKNCKDVIRDWAVRRGWDLKFLKNEKYLMIATCKNKCNWKLRASSVMKSPTFQIKSIKGRHTCANRIVNRQANSKYIGKMIEPFLRDNPT